LKIALFTEIYDCGGVDTFIVNLINHWPYEEDSFVIIANSNYPGLQIVENNVSRQCEIIRHRVPIYLNVMNRAPFLTGFLRIISPVARYLFIIYNILAFRKIFQEAHPDILMVINGGYPGGDSCRAAGISWGLFRKKPHSIHNFHNIAMRSPWYIRLQEYLVDAVLCRFTAQFVTVSRAAADSMAFRPIIYKNNMTTFIHNGIDIMPVQAEYKMNVRDEIGISSTTPLCLMLATYTPRKGHFFLFQAFKKVLAEIPNAHLLICGYGFPHEIKQVRQYIEDFQLGSNVNLMDFRNDVSHLLESADILVVPSQEYESFGFTSVEAMAHRVPVVATNNGGIPEVVVNDEGGYCVDSRDVDTYARFIVKLLKDDNLRKEQGAKGYERYNKFFTADRMASQYAKMLHEIIQ
jgi:glycosyltransferase involved in cell wall biosynthesis